jgi:type IV secretion system protein VirB4
LLFGKTEGSTPFRFSLHVGDVGHTLVVGPTGAGKSVLLALIALQFRRYPRSQVFAFDFGGSIRAAALAMRGDWHDLGGNASRRSDDDEESIATRSGAASEANMVSLQPLAGIHYTPERAWAADWIVDILAREGVAVTPEVKEHLWSALTSLASAPMDERTLTGLAVLLQSAKLKQALQPYCIGGPYGRLLDAETERLGEASVQAFETEGLIGTGAAGAVLAYLFHRIEGRLDGRPTLLIIDEGWLALDDGGFAAQLREWLKTLRKKNASVIFATQSLSDIDGSAIAPPSSRAARPVSSCPTSGRSSRRSAGFTSVSDSTIARSRSSPAPRPSATITASHGAAIACSSWDWVQSRSPSARPRPRPITSQSTACSPSSAVMPSSKPGSPTAACCGPPISFPT